MSKSKFNFMLYRLQKLTDQGFSSLSADQKFEDDKDIKEFLKFASSSINDQLQATTKSKYLWSFRVGTDTSDMTFAFLTKSVIESEASVVGNETLSKQVIVSTPPPAKYTMCIVFYWPRHMILVEKRTGMTDGRSWLKHLTNIFLKTAIENKFKSYIGMESIAGQDVLLEKFRDLDIVTRVKATIILPNPDLTRTTEKYKKLIEDSKIQEYQQVLVNPEGLSVKEESITSSVVELSEGGYSIGTTEVEGFKDGKFQSFTSREEVATGCIRGEKESIYEYCFTKAKAIGESVYTKLVDEIERLRPKSD